MFFSRQNFNSIFDILKSRFNQNYSYNIDPSNDRDKSPFSKELLNIMKTVYSNRQSFKIPPQLPPLEQANILSQKTIQIASSYFTDIINKYKANKEVPIRQPSKLEQKFEVSNNLLSNRPVNTSITNQVDVNSQYNNFLKQRDDVNINKPRQSITFESSNYNPNQNNDDVQKRYSELAMSRRNDYETLNSVNLNGTNMPQMNSINQNPSSTQSNNMQQTNSFLNEYDYENPNSMLEQQFAPLQNAIPVNKTLLNQFEQKPVQPVQETNDYNYSSQNNQMMSNSNIDYSFQNMMSQTNVFNPIQQQQPELNENPFQNQTTYKINQNEINTFENTFDGQLYESSMSDKNNISQNITNLPKSAPSNNAITNTTNYDKIQQTEVIQKLQKDAIVQFSETHTKLGKLIDILEKHDFNRVYETLTNIPKLIKLQSEQPLTIRTHNLIISSKDRDFTNTSFNKYNFRVVFGAENNSVVSRFVNTYNNDPSGNITYKTNSYVSSGLANPTISQVLKNVLSIKLRRVIIPKPRDEVFYPDPYYFVSVDEFNSNIYSTKSFSDKILCKVHYDKEVSFGQRKYLYYLNEDDDFTMFYASPLAKLDRITLKLLDSTGVSVKDVFNDIDFVTTDVSSNTDVEFYRNTFEGDRILVGGDTKNVIDTIGTSPSYSIAVVNLTGTSVPVNSSFIVNLSNQIEYIFEVKTTEPDPTNSVRPLLT